MRPHSNAARCFSIVHNSTVSRLGLRAAEYQASPSSLIFCVRTKDVNINTFIFAKEASPKKKERDSP